MFTNNWLKAIANQVTNGGVKMTSVSGGVATTVDNASPVLALYKKADYANTPSMYALRTNYSSAGGVVIGNGTTEPAVTDYRLSGDVLSGYSYTSSVTREETDEGATITAVYTITNNNTSAIQVSEIGLIAGSSNNNNESIKCLLERTVLDIPITIEPGGVGQVTYTVTVPFPTE